MDEAREKNVRLFEKGASNYFPSSLLFFPFIIPSIFQIRPGLGGDCSPCLEPT